MMLSSLRQVAFFTTIIFGASFTSECVAAPEQLDKILQEWRRRQDDTSSVTIAWETRQIFLPIGAPKNSKLVELPAFVSKLIIKGTWLRLESRIYTPKAGIPDSTTKLATFDGSNGMKFFQQSGGQEHNLGFVIPAEMSDEMYSATMAPVLMVYRPLTPGILGIHNPGQFEFRGTERIGDRDCFVIRRTAEGGLVEQIWVSSDETFRPVRYEQISNEVVMLHADIEYSDFDGSGLLQLSRWTVNLLGDRGQILEGTQGRVQTISVNDEVSDSQFKLVFPKNTLVLDKRQGKKKFLVTDDGTWVPYGNLILSTNPDRPFVRYVVLGMTVVVIVFLAYAVFRKHSASVGRL